MNIPYLVAKYVADPLRMEPINIGVVAFINGRPFSRFMGEEEISSGLDLRKVRGTVYHTGTYRQWIEYWHYVLSSSGSEEGAKKELKMSSRANYLIADGASLAIPQDASETDPAEVLDYLFHLIVTEMPQPDKEELTLSQRCEEIIAEYSLGANPHFRRDPVIECSISSEVSEQVRPTYAYVNGTRVYFQKVSLNPRRPDVAQKELHNAAWIFDKLRKTYSGSETKALVRITDPHEVASHLRVLNVVSTEIIDVNNDEQVRRTFSSYLS
jgi:hypothetical protein